MGKLVIRVVDRVTKKPVSGAVVEIISPTFRTVEISKKDGSVEIELPNGTYDVVIHHRGYEPSKERVRVTNSVRIIIELEPIFKPL